MRKSTAIIMGILAAGFGGILVAANSALGPLARDAENARALTRLLAARGDIAPDSRVRLLRTVGAPKRLAADGAGLVVRLAPSEAVLLRPGALDHLAFRVAEEGLGRYMDGRLDWVEITFETTGTEQRVLLRRDLGGDLVLDRGKAPLRPTPAGATTGGKPPGPAAAATPGPGPTPPGPAGPTTVPTAGTR